MWDIEFFFGGEGRRILQPYEESNPNDYKNVSFIEIGQLEAGQKSERHVNCQGHIKKNIGHIQIVMAFDEPRGIWTCGLREI